MKFIQFDEHRINVEAIDFYLFEGDKLAICFRSGQASALYGDRAAALVRLLDAAIGVAGEEA